MDPQSPHTAPTLEAGPFGPWLRAIRAAIAGTDDADVPCGSCTACCESSQFVHVAPDEHEALAAIPSELLFPAPGDAGGHLLGYDEHGRCPMLADGACSIYAQRPRTCRTYDCRVFPATDLVPDDKPLIAATAVRWRFSHPTDADRQAHEAVRATAAALADDASGLPPEARPRTATHLAVAAVVRAPLGDEEHRGHG